MNTMSENNLQELEELKPLGKPKSKFTLLETTFGTRMTIVSRGWLDTVRGMQLGYSEPRKRKIFQLIPRLQRGAIVLKGHEESRPVFEAHAPAQGGVFRVVLDPTKVRFIDHNEEGAEALIAYLKEHMLFHTVDPTQKMQFLTELRDEKTQQRSVVDHDFKRKLFEGLGPGLDIGKDNRPPKRVQLLDQAEKQKLMGQCGIEPRLPLYKIFMPEGVGTWLLYSMEPDGDTLWAVCDIGAGCVEYGTMSLQELELARGPVFGLTCERDKFFDPEGNPEKYEMKHLLQLETLNGV